MDLGSVNLIMDYYQAHWKYFDIEKMSVLLSEDFIYSQKGNSYDANEFIKVSDEKFFKSTDLATTRIDNFSIKQTNDSFTVTYDIVQDHDTFKLNTQMTDIFVIENDKLICLTRSST